MKKSILIVSLALIANVAQAKEIKGSCERQAVLQAFSASAQALSEEVNVNMFVVRDSTQTNFKVEKIQLTKFEENSEEYEIQVKSESRMLNETGSELVPLTEKLTAKVKLNVGGAGCILDSAKAVLTFD